MMYTHRVVFQRHPLLQELRQLLDLPVLGAQFVHLQKSAEGKTRLRMRLLSRARAATRGESCNVND